MTQSPRVTMLCGGVGGARSALALAENLPSENLTFIVNSGDDFRHLGLEIWPDWDTVVYHLAGLVDASRGWGRADEGVRAMQEWQRLGAPDWFHLGDRDLALHVYRSWALKEKLPAHQVAHEIAQRLGVKAQCLRATEDSLSTEFELQDGSRMDFQTWFVGHQGKPSVARVHVTGAAQAKTSDRVVGAVIECDLLLLAPSNPYLSILPMLEVEVIAQAVRQRSGPTWAVSPLVGGKAVKGPLDSLISELGAGAKGQQAIVEVYRPWIQRLLLPEAEIEGLVADPLTLAPCRTWLGDPDSRGEFCQDLLGLWAQNA